MMGGAREAEEEQREEDEEEQLGNRTRRRRSRRKNRGRRRTSGEVFRPAVKPTPAIPREAATPLECFQFEPLLLPTSDTSL